MSTRPSLDLADERPRGGNGRLIAWPFWRSLHRLGPVCVSIGGARGMRTLDVLFPDLTDSRGTDVAHDHCAEPDRMAAH